uniref:Protein TENP-like n=1 Tax=Nothoprocta perdicaria TaxID=30464 RepID=A0A8C6Z9W2_NOTPE
MARTCALGIVLGLLAAALASGAPDCGGILTPAGLGYLAQVSKQHAETILAQDLMAPRVSDLLLGSPKPTRNQIDSVKVVDLSLSLIPDAGLRLSIDADLGVVTAPSTSKVVRLSILADLQVERNPEGNLELSTTACKPTMEETQSTEEAESKSPSLEVDKELDVSKICVEVSRLLILPNEQLASLTAQFPVTPSCQVRYVPLAAPVISEQGVTVSLQTTFLVAGVALPLPASPTPFTMPESASAAHLTLALSTHFYTSFFFALETVGAFNMTLMSPLTTATIAQRISQMGSLFQEDRPVLLRVAFRSSPWVVLEEGSATLKLFLTAHVGIGSPDFQSILSMNVDMSAGLLLSVADVRMMVSAAAGWGLSGRPPAQAALLEELFVPALRDGVLARMNEVLSEGIYLPHASNFVYTDASVVIHKDYVLIPCNLRLQPRSGGQSVVG